MGTENKEIKNRLSQLRKKMKENGIDYYMIPTADFHNSEYQPIILRQESISAVLTDQTELS